MSSENVRPKWWQMYLTLPLLLALFAVDNRLRLSQRGHQVVQIGIVLFVYWVIRRWLKANARALSQMDQQDTSPTFRVTRLPDYSISEKGKRPLIQLPDSEIKGVLSDTFEMNNIEAEFLPSEEVPQDLNKE